MSVFSTERGYNEPTDLGGLSLIIWGSIFPSTLKDSPSKSVLSSSMMNVFEFQAPVYAAGPSHAESMMPASTSANTPADSDLDVINISEVVSFF